MVRQRFALVVSSLALPSLALSVPRKLELTSKLAPQLVEFGESSSDSPMTTKVMEYASPREIEAAFGATGVPVGLDGSAHGDAELLAACRETLKYSIKTQHPLFLSQLYGLSLIHI